MLDVCVRHEHGERHFRHSKIEIDKYIDVRWATNMTHGRLTRLDTCICSVSTRVRRCYETGTHCSVLGNQGVDWHMNTKPNVKTVFDEPIKCSESSNFSHYMRCRDLQCSRQSQKYPNEMISPILLIYLFLSLSFHALSISLAISS